MTNKLKYFVGNWKMFGGLGSIKIINKISKFSHKHKKANKSKIILCVPSTLIYFFQKNINSKHISLGAQNCHHNLHYGAFTGSINASMLSNAGAKYVILGHSENRYEGDTSKLIKKKIESSLHEKLNIIFCIGETLSERKKGKTFFILRNQIKNSIKKNFNLNKIIFSYEPVWSIGTNKIPKPGDLSKTTKFIKSEIKKIFNKKTEPTVLYGGSVNPKNISLFSLIPDIDGFLIGSASQSAKNFIDIIKNYYK